MDMFFLNRSIFLIENIILLYIFLESDKSRLFQIIAFILTWIIVSILSLLLNSFNFKSLLISYAVGSLYLIPTILLFKETYWAKIFVFYMIFSITQLVYLIFTYVDHFISPPIPQIFIFAGLMLELASLPLIKRYIKPSLKDIIKILNHHNAIFTLFPVISFLLLNSYAFLENYLFSTFVALILTTLLLFFSYYLIATSISVTKRLEELEQISITDSLTGLYNRRYLNQKIEQEYTRYLKINSTFALVTADIDLFKNINDQYGHDCGDTVLKSITQDIRNSIRTSDSVARWGGEEFLILLPATNREQAILLAERIRTTVEAHLYEFNNKSVSVTLTLGVAIANSTDTIDEIIKRADLALYYGKRKSRNCVISFNEIKDELARKQV
jgi:diguanylate cyclase (GGDEF)-like protein